MKEIKNKRHLVNSIRWELKQIQASFDRITQKSSVFSEQSTPREMEDVVDESNDFVRDLKSLSKDLCKTMTDLHLKVKKRHPELDDENDDEFWGLSPEK